MPILEHTKDIVNEYRNAHNLCFISIFKWLYFYHFMYIIFFLLL